MTTQADIDKAFDDDSATIISDLLARIVHLENAPGGVDVTDPAATEVIYNKPDGSVDRIVRYEKV